MKLHLIYLTILLAFNITVSGQTPKDRQKVSDHLQDISVTIKSEGKYSKSEGSGVLVTRTIDDSNVTFVWTCGHVVRNLRKVKTVIASGKTIKKVEFGDVQIVKELVENGRRVGEVKMDATVLKYSDADDGQDLALLMVRSRDYGKAGARFYLDTETPIIPIGTPLFHVGSLLGQLGANSMTSGIISQVGRIRFKVEYDQTTVTAFPGSSGGGVYLEDGRYIGMIVRGAGEGFNLMVPIRRMISWAKEHDIMWAIDPSVEAPTLKDIESLPIESVSSDSDSSSDGDDKAFPYLIRVTNQSLINIQGKF